MSDKLSRTSKQETATFTTTTNDAIELHNPPFEIKSCMCYGYYVSRIRLNANGTYTIIITNYDGSGIASGISVSLVMYG